MSPCQADWGRRGDGRCEKEKREVRREGGSEKEEREETGEREG